MNNDKWGPGDYLTVAGIGNLLYMVFRDLGSVTASGVFLFRYITLAFIAAWITILGYLIIEVTPWWVYAIITVAAGTLMFLVGYNGHIAKKKNIESQRQQQQAHEENLFFVETYLANLDFHYFDFEKKQYVEWLISRGFLNHFKDWSDTDRLQTMGEVTGKFYVCVLASMSPEQKVAKREAAWNGERRKQREKQLKINAEQKNCSP